MRTKSAFETAVFWELGCKTPRGIDAALAALLDEESSFAGCELVASFPEHRVKLPGGTKASQNDVWAILRSSAGLISLAVEGKAGETFDQNLGEWRKDASTGKDKRLAFLCEQLGIAGTLDDAIRYQLVHRAVSAIVEAERIGAKSAAMVVVSFVDDPSSKNDFGAFVSCLGSSRQGKLLRAVAPKRSPLFLGWLDVKRAPMRRSPL